MQRAGGHFRVPAPPPEGGPAALADHVAGRSALSSSQSRAMAPRGRKRKAAAAEGGPAGKREELADGAAGAAEAQVVIEHW